MDQRTIRMLAIGAALWIGAPLTQVWARPPIWQATAVPAEFQSAPDLAEWAGAGTPGDIRPSTDGEIDWNALEQGDARWLYGGGDEGVGAWYRPDWVTGDESETWDMSMLVDAVGGWLGGLVRHVTGGSGEADVMTDPDPSAQMTLYENKQVQKFMRLYLDSHREAFTRGLDRAGQYIPMIQKIFQREGLPADLAYLAIVESNLNPLALSPKRAAGLWQFMEGTAVHFGLRVEPWYDERLDPVLSTEAAARMLRYLHNKFGNWELALAAYNAGEGRVNRALRDSRSRDHDEVFWTLSLPLQTRRYVPSFIAVALIYNDLEGHGFVPFEPEAFMQYEVAEGPYYTTLREIARRTGMSYALLTELNPAWRQGLIPPVHEGDVILRVPAGGKRRVEEAMKSGGFEAPRMVTHRVARGETLTMIALRYGVDMATVLAANRIPNRNYLRYGRELLIPLPNRVGGPVLTGDKT